MAPGGRRRLGDLLLDARLISLEQLNAALHEQRKWGGRLGRTLVELGFITERALAEALAGQLKLEAVDLDTADIAPEAPRALRLDICERYGVFPVAVHSGHRTLTVATSDPTNLPNLEAVRFATGFKVTAVVSTATGIERAIRRYYFGEEPAPAPPAAVEQPAAAPSPQPLAPASGTSYELDTLLGAAPASDTAELPIVVTQSSPPSTEAQLRREVAVLKERVESLEELNTAQVKSLRALLELLIGYGLISRDEYLEKLHSAD